MIPPWNTVAPLEELREVPYGVDDAAPRPAEGQGDGAPPGLQERRPAVLPLQVHHQHRPRRPRPDGGDGGDGDGETYEPRRGSGPARTPRGPGPPGDTPWPGTMLPKVKKQNLLEGTFWSSF